MLPATDLRRLRGMAPDDALLAAVKFGLEMAAKVATPIAMEPASMYGRGYLDGRKDAVMFICALAETLNKGEVKNG